MGGKRFRELIAECLDEVCEILPWDAVDLLSQRSALVLDIREADEFQVMRIENSLNVPRGILEMACEYDYEETLPELVQSRERDILVVCRSGNRSILAAHTMQRMGYRAVRSLKTGLRGWNDYELPLFDATGARVDLDTADHYFSPRINGEQRHP